MEYFRERNGKFYAKAVTTGPARSPIFMMALALIPLGIFAFIYSGMSAENGESPDKTPFILGAVIIIFSSLLSLFLKSSGHSAGIVVNQMQRTISFKRPGELKHSMNIDSIEKIGLQVSPGKGAVLSLSSRDGTAHVLQTSREPMILRQMADELSILTSVTVSEETLPAN